MFRAKLEFNLNLHDFRNSELFKPGLYHLKLFLFHEDEQKIYYAKPVDFEEGPEAKKKVTRFTLFHNMKEPQSVEDSQAFISKTFLIRYADEYVKMGHTVKFETEVDVKRLHKD